MIKYLGSKRLLLPQITAAARAVPGARSALDLFCGTARVGHALKAAGFHVTANDHNAFAATLARCYVEADARDLAATATTLIDELNRLPPRPGYFTATYCERARYFQPKNGARIDAMRAQIAAWALPPVLEAVLLVALMEAADRVDSTTGLQMAYLKTWAPRAYHDVSLRLPALLPGPGRALDVEAEEAAAVTCDVAYLDPPYNQHSYRGNYHIWETLVRWDTPDVYGVACKREDCRAYRSPFNSRPRIGPALSRVLAAVRAPHLIVSFNNEGYLTRTEMEAMLAERGHVTVLELDFKRYVGAQIGIYNPRGERVGRVSHLRNKELLFFVSPDAATAEQMRAAALAVRAPARAAPDAAG